MSTETYGTRLLKLRKDKKMTQMDVAVAIGLSRPHLSNIERGSDPASREMLTALADFFDVSLDFLIHGTPHQGGGQTKQKAEREALLIDAFREIAPEDADHLLGMAQALANKGKGGRQ